jgi:hypothetical protein
MINYVLFMGNLYEWLKERWHRDNHKKYHKYFEVWFVNLTQSQINSFSTQEQKRNIYN